MSDESKEGCSKLDWSFKASFRSNDEKRKGSFNWGTGFFTLITNEHEVLTLYVQREGTKICMNWSGIEVLNWSERKRNSPNWIKNMKKILKIRKYLIYNVTRTIYCTQFTNYNSILVCNFWFSSEKPLKLYVFCILHNLWIYILILIRVIKNTTIKWIFLPFIFISFF